MVAEGTEMAVAVRAGEEEAVKVGEGKVVAAARAAAPARAVVAAETMDVVAAQEVEVAEEAIQGEMEASQALEWPEVAAEEGSAALAAPA